MKKRIVITGGTGRLGNELKKVKRNYKLFFPKRKKLDILKINTVRNFLKKARPNFVIHLAGLSRPMKEHEENIKKSISLNIIGTANLVMPVPK